MEGEASVDAGTVRSWLAASAVAIREQRDYLTQLDAAIGDADHGANMDRGFTAVVERLDGEASSEPPGKLLLTAGSTLVSTVGGASGPLWGPALRRAGRSLGDAEQFGAEELVAALDAALVGVVELGAASEGEKTMVDSLAPAVRVLRARVGSGAGLVEALAAAREAGEEGMRATVPLERSAAAEA
jgi:phosphoenolpyruvate---glycerone phosphotransferase subunit DhaL